MPAPVFTVLVDGNALDQDVSVLAIDVTDVVNRIPRARVTLAESFDRAEQSWSLGGRNLLAAGQTIEIRARDEEAGGPEMPLFKGVILGLSLEARAGDAQLTVEAAAGSHRLAQGRRSAIFTEVTDEDAIRRIVGDAGLSVERFDAPASAPTHESLVQHASSDWDFILARADTLGLLVGVSDTALRIAPMTAEGAADASIGVGQDGIIELALALDAGGQHPGLQAMAWSLDDLQASAPVDATDPGAALGQDSPASLGQALGLADWKLVHLAPMTSEELQGWADARLARRRLSMIRGRISLSGGSLDLAPLDRVELTGAGDAFSGTTLLTGLRHRILPGHWRMDLQFGLPAETVAETPGIAGPPAAGLLPAATGLQIGVVAGYEDDPLGEYRVRITLPAIGAGDEGTLWARLATPEAGDQRGQVFRPMQGDEVVVGFLSDDPRQPVVLGALFSAKNAPPEDFATPSEDNIDKGLAMKSGAALAFRDQDKPAAILRTKRGTITIDDDAKTIEVKDEDGNQILLGSDAIAIKSAKDLTIEASGKITIKGSQVEIA
jgi:Rhs element Vgr protein